MKLTNPTDEELNAAFAEKVAGEKVEHGEYYHDHPPTGRWMTGGSGPGVIHPNDGMGGGFYRCIGYCSSVDAVIPWLEKASFDAQITYSDTCCNWVVILLQRFTGQKSYRGESESFAKAAVIALLRAHGVEVEL